MDQLAERLKNMTPLQRAVFALKETQARLDAVEQKRAEPIAIVGMACRFPGGAWDAKSYWRLLCERVDAIREVPADRWDVDAFYDPDPAAHGKMNTRWGGFLDRIDEFDNHFFSISDREALRLDPQQRMLLELAWEAMEDAGIPPSTLRGSRTGVFVGIAVSEYGIMLSTDLAQTDAHAAAGTSLCLAANRLSFAFGLQGPSLALDTACSSALVAVHMACQNIRAGECDAALAGGANLILSPIGTVNLTKAGFCASDGRVRAFDAAASGYVRSEGAGLVLLKPLSAALKNRDPIYAVIRGSAVNQNGSSNGLTAPSRAAQEQVLREAYARARVSPGRAQFVETQGTGTRLGDAIEALALGNVLREGRAAGNRCAIGAVKSNIGHLETASGVASLMKVALALTHRRIPPNLHFRTPNPDIPFDALPLEVQQNLAPWPESAEPRIAGVSAFGFGGSNAHLVLEESPQIPDAPHSNSSAATDAAPVTADGLRPPTAFLLPLSARTERALADLAARYDEFLHDDPPAWHDVCYTAAARRDHHDCRLAVLAGSHAQALELLRAFGDGQSRPGVFQGRKPYGRSLKVAFVFDGNTERWKSCLPQSIPAFAAAAKDVEAALARIGGSSLADLRGDDPRWADPAFARPMTLALQMALAAWWRHVGLAPDAVLGQGVGELAAAATAGMLSLDDALRVAAATGGSGSSRGTSQSTLAGVPTRPALLPVLDASRGLAPAVAALGERHVDICLEIGPQAMSESIAQFLSANGSAAVALPSLAPSAEDEGDVLTALGVLYAAGADLAWEPLTPAGGRPVRLPTYPWQRQRLWAPTKKWLPAVVGAGQAGAASQPAAMAELPDERPSVGVPTAAEVHVRPELTTPYVAPGTELERTMARLWSEVLRMDRVGIHDNFFELGGDSLQVAILLNQLPAALGRQISLPLRDVFEARTIATLSGRIEAALQAAGAAATATDGPIPRIAHEGELPLSFNQESLWFLGRLEPDRPSYMLYLALNVKGPLNIPALERALNEIARRHAILRTRFPEVDGRPVQVIEPAASRSLSIIDLSDLPPSQREVELRRKIAVEMGRPIDFENGPLVRIILLRRGENDYVAAASLHHIIHDGWSVGLVLGELAVLYPAFLAGRPSPLPELPIQFADYAAWQRGSLQGETLERLQDYWRQQLADVSPLEIPTDFSRPAVRSTRGSSRRCELSRETSAAVLEFCRREGVTPYMVLLAAFEVLLARYSGQDDFAVGTPVANRGRPEVESLVGYLVNVIVLRASLAADRSFRESVGRVQRVALDAFEHQALSLDQVVHAVRPTRDLSRNPIFQVMFALHNLQLPSMPNLPLEITPLADCPAPPSANFDLTLELFQTGESFQGSLNFSTDLFDPATIDRMVGQYQVLVAAAIRDPDRAVAALPLLEEEEQREMLGQGRGPVRDYDREQPVHRLFETQAERQPEAVAVVLGDQRWSYSELNARANQLARFLRRQGVGPEVRVGICLDRSPQLVMALLAVMKAGGAYVPLDPAYTRAAEERFKYVLADAQVSLLLTDSALPAALDTGPAKRIVLDGPVSAEIDREGRDDLEAKASAAQLAYVLYTSGSTGRPKGVMVTQGNLLNAYHGWREAYRLESAARSHLQMASFSFDVFEGDLVRALCSGGKLVICRKEILLDPAELLSLMRRESVDIAEFVPIVLRNLVEYLEETGQTLEFMRLVIAGSDAWYVADHRRTQCVLGPRTRLLNSYGLTETTIDSSYFEGDVELRADTALVPIGRPFPNVQLYVLDERMRPAPMGVPGNLYIGGDGVARGYVNPDLNAERFPEDPFAVATEARLCRTGDRARWRADGQLEFLGRADNQVKIRGYRIEPREVEQVLREHYSVADAAVVARERSPGDLRLVAYVVGKDNAVADLGELKPFLADRLPDYMIPSVFMPLAALPATSSGKMDRKALPAPDWDLAAVEREFVAPRNPAEQQLAKIWAEVLNIERVGVHDNFFDLGGNSLLSLRLISRVRKECSVDLPLVAFFTAPTVGELAERIAAIQASGPSTKAPPILPAVRRGPVPMSFNQEAFWVPCRLHPEMPLSHLHAALPVRGELNVDALRQTVNEVVRRHEALRTSFAAGDDGRPVQIIAPELRVELPVEDLPADQREELIQSLSQAQASEVFDFFKGPLFRIRLLRFGAADHVLLITVHHIIADGWSVQVLIQEVLQLYGAFSSGYSSPMSALPIQYADYTLWQREYLQGEVLNALVGYWGEKLAGVESPALPADRPWRAEDSHLRGERTFRVSAEIRGRLERICRSENVTLFMLMLAAYKVLLYRYGQSDHVAVAVPVANRNRPETQELIGLFMNTLILRSDFHDDCSFREALRRVRKTVLDGFDHQDLPIELMIRELHFDYQPARYPFTHVLFNYHQPATTEQFPGRFPLELSYRSTDLNPLVTRFALDLTFTETGRGLDGMLEYDTALFDAHTIERIEGHLHQLLEAVIADPDRRLSQLQPLGEGGHQQAPVRRSPTGTADLPQAREQRSTPGGTVNWNAEIQLDSAIRVTADLRAPATKPSHVLLTGATGFLGAYLLRELLRRTSADVYCLVRAPNPDEARKKILRNLEQYELRGVRSSSRINPICGDLARPMLGLADDEYRRLAETVDVIYHNGAYVNFVYPYPMLKAINVTGTVEVLRLATQSKVKPVHFVSTLSVFESPEYGPLGKVDERQPLEALASLQTGYAQSKCVAEKLVQAAAARGLPVVVCRPGRVTADSATGAESMADYTTMLFKLCIELGMAPPAGDTVEMTPVDYVARSIVALAQSAESLGRTFHLMNPRPVPLGDIYEAIRSCGYDLREVPLDVLRSQAIEFGARSKDESFVAFAHWLTLMAPPAGEAGSAPPALACDETVQTLEHLGVVCPRVDVESLRKLLAFLNRKRALPTPPRTGGRMNTKPPLEKHASDAPVPWSSQRHSLVPLRREGSKRPLFLIHGLGGYVAALVPLARGLAVDCPVYGLQAQGLDAGQTPHDSIGAMAEFYLREIRTVQPTGPYLIGGWSMGGVIALEAARQLGEAGEAVSLLALLDSYLSLADFEKLDLDDRTVLRWIAPRLKLSATELRKLPLERQWERIEEQAMRVEGIGVAEIRRLAAVCKAHLAAICRYVRQPYPGPAVLFTASRGGGNPAGAWSTICPRLRVEPVSGDHYTMLCKPDVDLLADRLGHQLREALGVEK